MQAAMKYELPVLMKTHRLRAVGAILSCWYGWSILAAAFTPTIPPVITAPANGSTSSSATPLRIHVDSGDLPNVHSVQIFSNGVPIGWAVAPDFLGEWSFPMGAHLSVMQPDPEWGPNPPAFFMDYHPDDSSPMMFFEGNFVSPSRFVGTTGPHEVPPLAVAIDFTRVNDKVSIVITGDHPIGVRTHDNGDGWRHDRTQFTCEWEAPVTGVHNLSAKLVYTDTTSWEKEEYTTASVTITVKAPPAPEIDVKYAGRSLRDNKSSAGFGRVMRGAKGKAAIFTIRNAGTASLKGLKIEVKGPHSGDFLITQPRKTSIGSKAETTCKVTFSPRREGIRKAQLQIRSNDADENPFRVALQGTGIAGEMRN
jgi:hypothetical protein